MDLKAAERKIIRFIREQAKGATGVVVGVSGGIDSAAVAALCARALGSGSVMLLLMPERGATSRRDMGDAAQLAAQLGTRSLVRPINGIVDALKAAEPATAADRIALGNVKARARMMLLYAYANLHSLRVAGTGNRSEIMTGYTTKYGDSACDFLPIGGLTKSEVRQLAAQLGIPKQIIMKTPSAGLWPGQTDEGELGLPYGELDRILQGKTHGISQASIRRVRELMQRTRHKRTLPPVCRVR